MPVRPRWTAALVPLIAACLAPTADAAPVNDNYLASTILRTAQGGFPTTYTQTIDTTDATTQADLFSPDREGQPLGGGPAESTTCGGAPFGRTVWWDFAPPVAGAVELTADGFDTTIQVWEFDPQTSKPTRLVACAATAGLPEKFTVPGTVKPGRSYTVQVGGAGGIGGTLTLGFSFFGDRDADGVLDALPDHCPDLPGVSAEGGCPPRIRPVVSYRFKRSGGGVRLTSLTVSKVPPGAKVRASAGGQHQTRIAHGASVQLRGLVGSAIAGGGSLTVQVTRDRSKSGKYRFGAIGSQVSFRAGSRGLGSRVERCLLPGSTKPRKGCRRP